MADREFDSYLALFAHGDFTLLRKFLEGFRESPHLLPTLRLGERGVRVRGLSEMPWGESLMVLKCCGLFGRRGQT
jgi:hypothetical protein